MDLTDDCLRWEYQVMDDRVHGGRWVNKSLRWERQIWTKVYIGNVDLYAGTITERRACVYNTGKMNDIRMGHDVWWFMETTSVWTERSRNIEI